MKSRTSTLRKPGVRVSANLLVKLHRFSLRLFLSGAMLCLLTCFMAVAAPVAQASSVTIKEFPVSSGSELGGITAGPDGNLWFTQQGSNQIGRITPQGVVTEFALPTANSYPFNITAGPDGNLWFTQLKSNQIGRITTAGTITEFALPTANSSPVDITTGPDGNLWFTEAGTSQIGRITTTGAITEFAVPTANSKPAGITAGPDGNLWFTEVGANQIGRITTAGTITEFALPTANSVPNNIIAAPDGNLWFTETGANQIGRITTAGAITEFAIPTANSVPAGITVGPDNNLWFTEVGANQIGQLSNYQPDSDLGLTNMPTNITTNATSPQGTVVTYTPPTATDESGDSPGPSVSCSPASGSIFAIGTTSVTCTATDSDDSNSPVSASFTVTVNGAVTQVSNLIATVNSFKLQPPGIQTSFDSQLQAVQADLTNNNTAQACSDLTSFINHAQAQSGKHLTVSQANQLIAAAKQVQAVLGC